MSIARLVSIDRLENWYVIAAGVIAAAAVAHLLLVDDGTIVSWSSVAGMVLLASVAGGGVMYGRGARKVGALLVLVGVIGVSLWNMSQGSGFSWYSMAAKGLVTIGAAVLVRRAFFETTDPSR